MGRRKTSEQEVRLRRVMSAHKRAEALHEELMQIANDVHGTQLWLGAYERLYDTRSIRTWLAGYLDFLRHRQ